MAAMVKLHVYNRDCKYNDSNSDTSDCQRAVVGTSKLSSAYAKQEGHRADSAGACPVGAGAGKTMR